MSQLHYARRRVQELLREAGMAEEFDEVPRSEDADDDLASGGDER